MKNLYNLLLIGGLTSAQRAPKLPCQHGKCRYINIIF